MVSLAGPITNPDGEKITAKAVRIQEHKVFKTQITTRLLVLVVLVDICAMMGCHRGYYRRQADAEAARLVQQKSCDPRWDDPDGDISIDPMSRMFDPFSADHPPIPPDDPASHQLMYCVDEKPGYPHWHANGDTDHVSNPEWKAFLPVNERGQLVLDLDRAFKLALLHSPEYQQARETLYQSALDVSLERFGFDSQLFAGFNSFYTALGRFRNADPLRPFNPTSGADPPGIGVTDPARSSSVLASSLGVNGGGITLEKLGITGTNFVVGLANTILWNLGGSNDYSADSLVNFSIIQPLLRNAGRDRIMEQLTQSERRLLANVRRLERFRRGFFLEVATGRNAGATPSLGGAFTFLAIPVSATTNIGGYYGLLLQQQEIRNQELNVRQLEEVLELFREFFAAERLDPVQLKLFEGNVYNQQSQLLNSRIFYQTEVDRFVRSLGLPPDLPVVIEDDFLSEFEFISDQINDRLIDIGSLSGDAGIALNAVDSELPESKSLQGDELAAMLQAANFSWTPEIEAKLTDVKPFVEDALDLLASIKEQDIPAVFEDFEKLDAVREDRVAYLEKLRAAIDSGKLASDVDPLLYQPDSIPLRDDLAKPIEDPNNERSIVNRIAALEEELQVTLGLIENLPEMQADMDPLTLYRQVENVTKRIPPDLSELENLAFEISLLQARARSNSVEIRDVEIDADLATRVARCFRRDWMNARAALVDQWRQIEFVADNLESQFDLILEGDLGNVGDNPFKLRYETGQLRGGFRFDAPIVRLAERNQYRNTLINYQQTRRAFYQFEDEISRNIRQIIRNLDRDKVLFELNRRSVQVQIEQIELNRLSLEEPVGLNGGNQQLGAATARNLADAINGLNNSQSQYTRTWVEYEILRRSLDFDMGTMQIDDLGFWIDPGVIDGSIGFRAADAMGFELDCQFCDLTDYTGGTNANAYGEDDVAPGTPPDPEMGTRESNEEIQAPTPAIDAPKPPTEGPSIPKPAVPEDNSYYRPATGNEVSGTRNRVDSNNQSVVVDSRGLSEVGSMAIRDLPDLSSSLDKPAASPVKTVSVQQLLSDGGIEFIPSSMPFDSSTEPSTSKSKSILWKSEFQSFGEPLRRFSSEKSQKQEN